MTLSMQSHSSESASPRNGLFKLFKKNKHSDSPGSSKSSLDHHGNHSNHSNQSLPTNQDDRCTFRVGVSEDANHKFRWSMEDAHTFIYNFADQPDWGYFAIFDGHAGHGTANWCSNNIHVLAANYMAKVDRERERENLKNKDKDSPDQLGSSAKNSVCHALYSAFIDADQQIGKLGLRNSGSTAAVAILRWEPVPCESVASVMATDKNSSSVTVSTTASTTSTTSSNGNVNSATGGAGGSNSSSSLVPHRRVLYVANVGDTRVVLSQGGKALRLTYDHKGSDPYETKRINNLGGIVIGNRVNGVLAVTRSLGDSSMKEFVTGAPYTTETVLTDQDDFLILACDGLWDVCDDQTAVTLIKDIVDPTKASKKLVEYALSHGSSDNLTCMVVRLSWKTSDQHSTSSA